jgi:septum formation protein
VRKIKELILASGSPRRKELLQQMNILFKVHKSDCEESFSDEQPPSQIVIDLAEQKAKTVFQHYKDDVVIGADTVVVRNGVILGKPENEDEAIEMLQSLSGSTHSVWTGVAIVSASKSITFSEETKVTFWQLSDEEILSYVKSGEPFDKAGAYGIQGLGAYLVKSINGDYFNVVGLPISRTMRELKRMGAI